MVNAKTSIKKYLRSEFVDLLNNPNILEWIDAHVERGSPPATYMIIDKLKKFVSQ
jgi:hypothetical protein